MPRMFTPVVLLFTVLLLAACENAVDQPATAPDVSAAVTPDAALGDVGIASSCPAPTLVSPTSGYTIDSGPLVFQLPPVPHCRQLGHVEIYDDATGALVHSNTHADSLTWMTVMYGQDLHYSPEMAAVLTSGKAYRWRFRSRQADPYDTTITHQWSPWSSFGTFVYTNLSPSISGPVGLSAPDTYTWTASATGGAGSYTYEWYYRIEHQTPTCRYQSRWMKVGTGSTYSRYVGGHDYDFELRLDVTSGGETRSAYHKAYVNFGSPICPM